jgi:mutator protein MutT
MNSIVVTAAVIEREGRVLVTRRLPDTHLAGHWEFPGGKCQPGESLAACMIRELKEELDVDAIVGEEVLATTHEYPERRVELHFLRCEIAGDPHPMLGQEMRWVAHAELGDYEFPPADAELIARLRRGVQRPT